jgi:hypothetical protein
MISDLSDSKPDLQPDPCDSQLLRIPASLFLLSWYLSLSSQGIQML